MFLNFGIFTERLAKKLWSFFQRVVLKFPTSVSFDAYLKGV